jgi:hypothetical protein
VKSAQGDEVNTVGAPLDVERGRVARPGGAAAPGGARPVPVRTTETCVILAGSGNGEEILKSTLYSDFT